MPPGESPQGVSRPDLGVLRYLPRALTEPRHPVRAIVVGWLTAILPSLLLSALLTLLPAQVERPRFDVGGAEAVAMLVLFAPVAETLIMGAALLLLLQLFRPPVAVLLSALGWGIAHSLMAPAWGLVIWWPFLVFSTLFVTWLRRSLALALIVPACVHALQNLPPALWLAVGVSG